MFIGKEAILKEIERIKRRFPDHPERWPRILSAEEEDFLFPRINQILRYHVPIWSEKHPATRHGIVAGIEKDYHNIWFNLDASAPRASVEEIINQIQRVDFVVKFEVNSSGSAWPIVKSTKEIDSLPAECLLSTMTRPLVVAIIPGDTEVPNYLLRPAKYS